MKNIRRGGQRKYKTIYRYDVSKNHLFGQIWSKSSFIKTINNKIAFSFAAVCYERVMLLDLVILFATISNFLIRDVLSYSFLSLTKSSRDLYMSSSKKKV